MVKAHRVVPSERFSSLLEEMVRDGRATLYGRKYIVDGWLAAPIGRVGIRTVWIVREGVHVPEFVTAFPHSLPEEER